MRSRLHPATCGVLLAVCCFAYGGTRIRTGKFQPSPG
jgi:hypothetical protein